MEILANHSLKEFAWWKIGGPADYFCLPESLDDLKLAIAFAQSKSIPITVLGGGTNVLISDAGVEGLVIGMRKFTGVEEREHNGRLEIVATAGTSKSELTKIFLKRKMAPALFLCGLPGDIGGGVVMNAGVGENITPREFNEITDWVEVLSLRDGQVRRLQRNEMHWSYRESSGWQPGIVVRAQISWPLEIDPDIPRRVTEATKVRRSKQPLELPSCGSTFKNPPGHKAGALIEQAGLKGLQIGGVQVSPKHANFIVNLGGGKATDVLAVINKVKSEVKARFGVELETEVRLLGRF